MKTKKIIFSALYLSLIMVFACSDDIEESSSLEEGLVALNESEDFESSYSLLDYSPNVYWDFFSDTENTIGFSSLNPGPLQDFSVYQVSDLKNGANNVLSMEINNVASNGKNGTLPVGKGEADQIFGRTIKINFKSKSGKTFKNGSSSKEVEMYVPQQLNISNPKVEGEDDLMPYCYYKDFVLEWNADPENTEGLVVVAEYTGISAIPSKDKRIHIVNSDVIKEDNGKAVLNNEIWKGIPDTGVVTVSLMRGNVKIEEIDEENYKFFAEAHVVLPIILIKDMNTLDLN